MSDPLNAEHIEAIEWATDNALKACDFEAPETIDAIQKAREILRKQNIPHVIFAFVNKKVDLPGGGEIFMDLPFLRHNFFDFLRYLEDSDMIDEESGDQYDDFNQKFLYEVFRYFCPIDQDSRFSERLQDFHEKVVEAHTHVKDQIKLKIEEIS